MLLLAGFAHPLRHYARFLRLELVARGWQLEDLVSSHTRQHVDVRVHHNLDGKKVAWIAALWLAIGHSNRL